MVSLSYSSRTMRAFLGVVLIVFLAPALLQGAAQVEQAAAENAEQEGPDTALPPTQDQPENPQIQPSDPEGGSLIGIGAYEIGIAVVEFAPARAESQSLSGIVNPFRVKTRGRYYGSLYEFHRNDNFDARNFFDPVGEALPEFKRNQFGVSLGAFVSNRLTVSGDFDSLRLIRGSTKLSHVPTPEMKAGDFSSLLTQEDPIQLVDPLTGQPFQNNQIPQSRINPVAQTLLPTLLSPNRADSNRNFVNNQPEIENNDKFSFRVDYEFSQDSKLFANYRYSEGDSVRVASLPAFGSSGARRNQNVSVDYTHTFSESLVSSLRLEFNRSLDRDLSQNAGQAGLLESLGISGVSTLDELDEGYPEFSLAGYVTLGDRTNLPRKFLRNEYEFNGTFTYAHRQHRLGFGAEIAFKQLNDNRSGGLRRGSFDFDGNYTGDAFADFLLGIPTSAERGVGSDRADLRGQEWEIFFRDDWKLNPRFNLSWSLTYNYFPPWRSVHDNVATFYPLVFEPPLDGEMVVIGSERAAMLGLAGLDSGESAYPDRNDWAPSLGLAYSPLGNNRLVIRSSYQINYDPIYERQVSNFIGRNFPFYFVEESVADTSLASPEIDLSNPFETLTPTERNVRSIDPYIRNSYIQEWTLSVQNEILRNWNLEFSYRGTKETRNSRNTSANVPLPGPGSIQDRRPNPFFGAMSILTGSGSSAGHELELEVKKRFSEGYSLQSGFTWNRTFSDGYHGQPSNPRNLAAERAVAGFNMSKSFFLNYIIDLPFGRDNSLPTAWAGKLGWLLEGWRLSGITKFEDGRPFNPTLRGDPNNDGVSADRPDRIGPGTLDPSQRSIDQWFATEDFADPDPNLTLFPFGNSGRNILVDPGEMTWDISVMKRTKLSDDGGLVEFRVQLFNAFNHTNFEAPDSKFGTSNFGQIFGAKRAREIEIALKYSF